MLVFYLALPQKYFCLKPGREALKSLKYNFDIIG